MIEKIFEKEKNSLISISELRKAIAYEIKDYLESLLKRGEIKTFKTQRSINEFYFQIDKLENLSDLIKTIQKRELKITNIYHLNYIKKIKIAKIETNKKDFEKILFSIFKKFNKNEDSKLFGIILASNKIMFNLTHLFFALNFEKFYKKVNKKFNLYLYTFKNFELTDIEKQNLKIHLENELEIYYKLNNYIKSFNKVIIKHKFEKIDIEKALKEILNNQKIDIYYDSNAFLYIPVHLLQYDGILYPWMGGLLIRNLHYAINISYFNMSTNIRYYETFKREEICVGDYKKIIGDCEFVLSIFNGDSAYNSKILKNETFIINSIYSIFAISLILKKLAGG